MSILKVNCLKKQCLPDKIMLDLNKALCILWSGVMDWSLGLELWSGVLGWILGVEPWSEISSVTENSILVVKFF